MSVYALQDTSLGPRVAGVLVFPVTDEAGTYNVYAGFSTDLGPFEPEQPPGTKVFWKVTYFAEGMVNIQNPTLVSKLEGFPDRYRIGSYRWQGGGRSQPIQFIDQLNWGEEWRHTAWVTVSSAPNRDFYEEEPTEVESYDGMFPLSYGDGIETTQAALCQAELFTFYLHPGVEMQINVQYVARYVAIGEFEGVPQDVFLPIV